MALYVRQQSSRVLVDDAEGVAKKASCLLSRVAGRLL